jgi:hypothetical protein
MVPSALLPPKEGVLRIFIVFKILPSSTGFEAATLGCNGKHDNLFSSFLVVPVLLLSNGQKQSTDDNTLIVR